MTTLPDLELSLNYSTQMVFETSQKMSSELEGWRTNPFKELKDTGVVLRNLKVPSNCNTKDSDAYFWDDQHSDLSNLEKAYIDMRSHLIIWGMVIIVTKGRNKAGKGGVNMGLHNLFENDLYLQHELNNHGYISFDKHIFPFAHCAEAAKLEEVGLVRPNLTPSTYSFKDEKNISSLQWKLMLDKLPEADDADEISEILRRQGKAKVFLVESSTPLALPTTYTSPVNVEGRHDLGSSTFYNATLDERTRKHTFALMVRRGPKIRIDKSSNEFRKEIFADHPNFDLLIGGETRLINKEVELNMTTLSFEEQEELQALLKISMAPREAIKKLDRCMNRWLMHLYKKGIISKPNELAYYEFIRQKLHLPGNQCLIPVNNWIPGNKDYLLSYLRSDVIQMFPKILEQARDLSYKLS